MNKRLKCPKCSYEVKKLIKLAQTIHEAGAVARKEVYGSEARLAGKGCQTFAFVRLGICFFSFLSAENYHRSGFLGLQLTYECMQRAGIRDNFTIHRYCLC